MLEKIYHGLMNFLGVGRGIVVSDDGDAQTVQVSFNQIETKDNVPRYTDYGFQSSPPDGHNALVLFFGGNKSNGVVVATNHPKSRKRGLKKGEVCISDDQGQYLIISRDGIKLVDKAGSTVELNAGNITAKNKSGSTVELIAGNVSVENGFGSKIQLTGENINVESKSGSKFGLVGGNITAENKLGSIVKLTGENGSIETPGKFTINGVEFQNGIAKALDFEANGISSAKHHHKDSIGGDTSSPLPE